MTTRYVGRFAPSPTGPLHAGSLVAALASYLDALVHGGRWLLRIDDADLSRVQQGAATTIATQLKHYGFVWHGAVTHTRDNRALHRAALVRLDRAGHTYFCTCTRAELQRLTRSSLGERVYDRRCAQLSAIANEVRAVRLNTNLSTLSQMISFSDRMVGEQTQDVALQVGDFVLWRPEHVVHYKGGLYNYQLTMPVDDAAACVTHVVRGADLLGNTARQLYVSDLLGLTRPSYLHLPLVIGADGVKLSKQHGAVGLACLPSTDPLPALKQALCHLGVQVSTAVNSSGFWRDACAGWEKRLLQLNV